MTLSRSRSYRRDRRICRFGVMLVVVSLVINMVAVPKAEAVVIDAAAAFGAAATTAAINGTTATTLFTGMGSSAATNGIILYMDAYATATGVAASGAALASTIATGILVTGGVLLVGAAAAALIGGFLDWMKEQEGLEAGGDDYSVSSGSFVFTSPSLFEIL